MALKELDKVVSVKIGDLIELNSHAAYIYTELDDKKTFLALVVNMQTDILLNSADIDLKDLEAALPKEDIEIVKLFDVMYTVVCQNKILEVTVGDIKFE